MGYSKSPSTARAVQPQLRGIEEGRDSIEWKVAPGQASRWAYKIREALRIADRHPTEFPFLTGKSKAYEICEVAHDRVVAKRIEVLTIDLAQTERKAVSEMTLPAGVEIFDERVVPLSATSVVQVVQTWLDRQNDNPLRFVFDLSNPEIREIISWADSMGWSLWQKGDRPDFILSPRNVQLPGPWQVVSL